VSFEDSRHAKFRNDINRLFQEDMWHRINMKKFVSGKLKRELLIAKVRNVDVHQGHPMQRDMCCPIQTIMLSRLGNFNMDHNANSRKMNSRSSWELGAHGLSPGSDGKSYIKD
jgi:hypothetical protein